MVLTRLAVKFSPEFEVAWRQLQQMGIPAIQHPRCLAIPDFSNPVRWGGHLWLQCDSVLGFAMMF